jgi:hypothetical protein
VGRNNSKTSIGSRGHVGGTRSGQTWKKTKDLSTREGEERGRGGGGGVYVVFKCEGVGQGQRGRYGRARVRSDVIYT